MSSVTTVGGITVTGQRRVAHGLGFPIRSPVEPGGTGDQPDTLPEDPNWGQQELLAQDPCGIPDAALEWNLDAAAAIALQKMRVKAASLGEPDFAAREYGTAIYRFPDGSIRVGAVRHGAEMGGAVDIWWDEYPVEYLISSIHSHPSSGRPSPPDLEGIDYIQSVSNNGAHARIYVVQPTYEAGSNTPLTKIFVYNPANRDGQDNGPEVNPEALPCPGATVLS